ncbi:MAG TPA: hypothetical protein VFY73_21490 [Ideonella sp.]|nr:hypothetical protein [Ideonella sp.]
MLIDIQAHVEVNNGTKAAFALLSECLRRLASWPAEGDDHSSAAPNWR